MGMLKFVEGFIVDLWDRILGLGIDLIDSMSWFWVFDVGFGGKSLRG